MSGRKTAVMTRDSGSKPSSVPVVAMDTQQTPGSSPGWITVGGNAWQRPELNERLLAGDEAATADIVEQIAIDAMTTDTVAITEIIAAFGAKLLAWLERRR